MMNSRIQECYFQSIQISTIFFIKERKGEKKVKYKFFHDIFQVWKNMQRVSCWILGSNKNKQKKEFESNESSVMMLVSNVAPQIPQTFS